MNQPLKRSSDPSAPVLEKAGKFLEEMFDFAPIGICHVDTEGRIAMINSEFAWMLGYESATMLKNHVIDYVDEVFFDKDRAEDFLFTLYEADQVSQYRCRLKKKNGSYVWAQCYARVTRDEFGKTNGFYGYAVNISDTVKAEDSLKEANEQLMILSVMDGLTGIPNRRKFDQCLESEWRRHLRSRKKLSVIICDIDFFKSYNDTYGHQAGDLCLQQVAKAIDACVGRPGDLTARYGGEEFGIILPETDVQGARSIAEKIRKRIVANRIEHKGSKLIPWVTMSLGVGTLIPKKDRSISIILKMADQALYRAKENGRNQVIASDAPAV